MKKILAILLLVLLSTIIYAECVKLPALDLNTVPFKYDITKAPIKWYQCKQGDTFTFTIGWCDPDGDPVTVKPITVPAGTTFNSTTGVVIFKPTTAGVYYFTFEATDAPPSPEASLSTRETWVINVTRGNKNPNFLTGL